MLSSYTCSPKIEVRVSNAKQSTLIDFLWQEQEPREIGKDTIEFLVKECPGTGVSAEDTENFDSCCERLQQEIEEVPASINAPAERKRQGLEKCVNAQSTVFCRFEFLITLLSISFFRRTPINWLTFWSFWNWSQPRIMNLLTCQWKIFFWSLLSFRRKVPLTKQS